MIAPDKQEAKPRYQKTIPSQPVGADNISAKSPTPTQSNPETNIQEPSAPLPPRPEKNSSEAPPKKKTVVKDTKNKTPRPAASIPQNQPRNPLPNKPKKPKNPPPPPKPNSLNENNSVEITKPSEPEKETSPPPSSCLLYTSPSPRD